MKSRGKPANYPFLGIEKGYHRHPIRITRWSAILDRSKSLNFPGSSACYLSNGLRYKFYHAGSSSIKRLESVEEAVVQIDLYPRFSV